MQATVIVPYVSEEPRRERTFSSSMEKAAILCLAEAKRRKPKILGGPPREIEYIAKIQYPVWRVPWRNRCIFVDGLGLSSAAISRAPIPNVLEFTEDLTRSSASLSEFQKALEKHKDTFKEFFSTKVEKIDTIVGDIFAVESLSNLINQALIPKEVPRENSVLVPPKILMENVGETVRKVDSEWQKMRMDILAAQYALDMLRREDEYHETKISIEIKQIMKNYEERIYEMKKVVGKRVNQIIKGKDREIKSAAKLNERKLNVAIKEEKSVQAKIERLKYILEENMAKREHVRARYSKSERNRLDSKIRFYKERIRELSLKRRTLSRWKEDIQRNGQDAIKAIEEKHQAIIAKEMEKIEILEESRNLEISQKNEDTKIIQERSSLIEVQMKRLTERLNDDMKRFEEMTLPTEIGEMTLIGIQFYLVQYRTPGKTAIDVYPPVTAMSYDGIIRNIQKAIFSFSLEARIQLLLSPRSTALNETLFEGFNKSLETDLSLEEKIREIGRSNNLLELPGFREEISRGLDELEAEAWINAQEKRDILGIYVT